jgi:hypothetical protein
MSFDQQRSGNDQVNVKDRAQEANPQLNLIDLQSGSQKWGQDSSRDNGSADKYLPGLSLNYGGEGAHRNQSGGSSGETSLAGGGNNAASIENAVNPSLTGNQSSDAGISNAAQSAVGSGGDSNLLQNISSTLQTDLTNLSNVMQQFTTDFASAENSLGLGSDTQQPTTVGSDNAPTSGSTDSSNSNDGPSFMQQLQSLMSYLGIPSGNNSSPESTSAPATGSDTTPPPSTTNNTVSDQPPATTAATQPTDATQPTPPQYNIPAPGDAPGTSDTTSTYNTATDPIFNALQAQSPETAQILSAAQPSQSGMSAGGYSNFESALNQTVNGGQYTDVASAGSAAALTLQQSGDASDSAIAVNAINSVISQNGDAPLANAAAAPSDNTTPTPASTTDNTTGFQVGNGQLTINGQTLAGVNVQSQTIQEQGATTVANEIKQNFPGINSVRLMTSPNGGAYSEGSQVAGGQSVQDIENTVAAFNADGIGVIIDNHDADANATDSAANAGNEAAWFGQLAQGELGNNMVMFQTLNEPTGSNQEISNEQVSAYNAIRATGSTNVVSFDEAGGGYAGPMTSDSSAYESMSNIAFDAHAYAGSNSDPVPGLQTEVAQTAGMTEAGGGQIPVYIGEIGNSESGGLDAAFPQLASYVASSGLGAEWFTYSGGDGSGDTVDNMTNPSDGSLNSYGTQVAGLIAQSVAADVTA